MKRSLALLLAIIILFTGCNLAPAPASAPDPDPDPDPAPIKELKRYQASFLFLFDTVTYIVGYGENEAAFEVVAKEIQAELEEYHKLYDIYNQYPQVPNLYTINQMAGKAPVRVDSRLIDLLEFGFEMHKETEGLMNMAMGSVLNIWHDYRTAGNEDPESAKLPPLKDLEEANKHTDITKVIIDREAGTVFLQDPEMRLDVGSIGKGYAVEQVALSMEAKGYDHIMMSVGGNVRAIGKKPTGAYWDAGLENPYGGKDFVGVVEMDSNSLVTSGNYERFYTVEGINYHHIINPTTLMPDQDLTAVAILCPDSGIADAYTTAIFNMSYEEGKKWVEVREGIEAMWMFPDQRLEYSSGFEKHLRID